MNTKNELIKALKEITPAGLFDVCRAFDHQLMTKDGSTPVESIEQAEQLDHDNVNRVEVIEELVSDSDYCWTYIAEYLGIESSKKSVFNVGLENGFVKMDYASLKTQLEIVSSGNRRLIIDWLNWNDGNGCYSDQDCIDEGLQPLTLESVVSLMVDQMDVLESLVSEFNAFCAGAGFSGAGDARELLADDNNGLTADQREWLTDFIERWETVENRGK